MDDHDALLRLHHAAGNTAWLRDALAGDAEGLLHAGDAHWHALGVAPALRARALGREADAYVAAIRHWQQSGPKRHVVGWTDAAYPSLLREAPSPPLLLFVEGHVERLWWPQVAIVGSRAPTPAGEERAARWAHAFAEAGYVVTSGLASGIDAAAHAACLDTPGTIAVTATGPDRCFPAGHRSLHAAITQHGAIVTEHAPGTAARPEHFPSRNRIIAGLSLATVVIEAAQRSGALITARLAAESGREVFALPGAPENPKARGCHRLIRDGATLADEPGQVLEGIASASGRVAEALRHRLARPSAPTARGPRSTLDLFDEAPRPSEGVEDARVRQALGVEGGRFDELLTRSGLTPTTLAPILTAMELEGRLTQQHGVYAPCGATPPTRAERQRRR